jgi:hypothetical protein
MNKMAGYSEFENGREIAKKMVSEDSSVQLLSQTLMRPHKIQNMRISKKSLVRRIEKKYVVSGSEKAEGFLNFLVENSPYSMWGGQEVFEVEEVNSFGRSLYNLRRCSYQ